MGFGSSSFNEITLNTQMDPEHRETFQNTHVIRDLLGRAKTIAIVGLSTESTKASNMVGSYMQDEGYRVIPVNPRAAGSEILGELVYPDLKSIPEHVDIVNVFRPSKDVAAIVDQAIEIGADAVWTQLRIIDTEAGQKALDVGLEVVMDKCIKMEHGRFGGALHFAGMNTEVITAKRKPR
jgi:uncharacterized protein